MCCSFKNQMQALNRIKIMKTKEKSLDIQGSRLGRKDLSRSVNSAGKRPDRKRDNELPKRKVGDQVEDEPWRIWPVERMDLLGFSIYAEDEELDTDEETQISNR